MTDRHSYPVFASFLRAYLHQDLGIEHGTAERALAAFLRAASDDERAALREECQTLAAHVDRLSLAEIRRLLTEQLHGAWWPARKRDVLRLLRAAAASSPP